MQNCTKKIAKGLIAGAIGFTWAPVSFASDCEPKPLTWGANCSAPGFFIEDGKSRTIPADPKTVNGSLTGIGSATFKCEVGNLKYLSGTCGGLVDAYAAKRVATLPSARTAPATATSAQIATKATANSGSAKSVTTLTGAVSSEWVPSWVTELQAKDAEIQQQMTQSSGGSADGVLGPFKSDVTHGNMAYGGGAAGAYTYDVSNPVLKSCPTGYNAENVGSMAAGRDAPYTVNFFFCTTGVLANYPSVIGPFKATFSTGRMYYGGGAGDAYAYSFGNMVASSCPAGYTKVDSQQQTTYSAMEIFFCRLN